MAEQSHTGRVAVVTGASRGIGQAICHGLAERGASVVGVDILEPEGTGTIVEQAGARWLGVTADLTAPDAASHLAEKVDAAFGRCDILVNNAAIDDAVSWDELDTERWKAVMAVNLDAPFHLCRALIPHMRRNRWGRIVNIASGSVLNPMPRFVAYRASKLGLIGFSRALATEVGDDGITVNVVSPGVTVSPMAQESLPQAVLEQAARQRAIHRHGTAEDVVGPVLFLTSDDSEWITGQTLLANGGATFV
jgi:NAD(P)-dependent dehydrogenase (short-subunit alcohol dehydrogenase family)